MRPRFPHHRVGDHQRHRDLDVSHPHAVSEHRIAHAHAARGPPAAQQLESLRHASLRLSPLEVDRRHSGAGYWRAYKDFYRWGSILQGALTKEKWSGRWPWHFAYAAGWKKFEPLWDFVIRAKRVTSMLPLLETILEEFGTKPTATDAVSATRTNRTIARSRTGNHRLIANGGTIPDTVVAQDFIVIGRSSKRRTPWNRTVFAKGNS